MQRQRRWTATASPTCWPPVGPNACDTGLRGACAKGFAACEDGKRICLAPPPMPEVNDGIDNDCNGVVDDVPAGDAHPRVLVAGPRYTWTEAAADIATVSETLAAAGIPFDKQPVDVDWRQQHGSLDNYAVVVVPGYLLGATVSDDVKAKLEAFASRGGVVILWKPIGSQSEPQALALAGLASSSRHRDVAEIRVASTAPPTAAIDSPEERRLVINSRVAADSVEVWVLEPDPAAKTETIASAYVDGHDVGAAITRAAASAQRIDLRARARPRDVRRLLAAT